ncbi:MAG: hypothetical protein IPK53_01385 [bacterium]|nr:hypothetical protein [bacterium]
MYPDDETPNTAEPTTPDEQPEQTADAQPEQPTESFSTESLESGDTSSPIPHSPSPIEEGDAAENLAQLAAAIAALDRGHMQNGVRQYKEFFDHAKEVGALFKTLKPLPHADRERLWQEFSALCDDVRVQQNSEREEQKLASLELRGKLEAQLIELQQNSGNAKFADDFNALADKLKHIREAFTGTKDHPGPLVPKDREALWKLWKATDDSVWAQRKAVREDNYAQGKEHMQSCSELAATGDPFDCHKKIKELRPWQRSAELSREQRDEIRKALDAAWEIAAARIEGERAERKKQYEQWTERTSGLVAEWEDKLVKMRDFRVRLEEQIARLNDMERNARTDEFANQVAGWREEKEAKLADVDSKIAQLAEKIDSVKKRLK